MNFTVVNLFFLFVLSLIGRSSCAIECIRYTETSLTTLFKTNSTQRNYRQNDWFPTNAEEQIGICRELAEIIFDTPSDNLEFRGIFYYDNTNVDIHGTPSNPQINYKCLFRGREIRIFPILKTNTVFVSVGSPSPVRHKTRGYILVSILNYCFQLAPYYSTLTEELQSQNSVKGIPNDYELLRSNSIQNNTFNPFNTLLPQERYALCRLIFEAEYFSGMDIDLQVPANFDEHIVTYDSNTVFDEITGESMENISFEDPKKPTKFPVPPKYFGPEKVVWCDATNGSRYFVIWAYNGVSVYVMEKVDTFNFLSTDRESIVSFPLYRNLTRINDVAAVDKLRGEFFF